ncbi:MAG: hypothetical protein MPEBLZ_01406 [Candidatus Methanoperedens nitroreducens]|uniref:Uncharacterized protein n=1 Tax=Candidatus Methanoperedens nitratireducens TaxID=1392998 RepID=A0A0P8CLF6_9EURY|nr:hypothetical protein [Candidatus Methanoperedens sp. BLZ2]KPQ44005.1 MAG: hypothetical protein MPEBLZ_01406 [Candidatus Methanoperedens sp. BLZ1]MBZ0177422.1 hypothetical protein [Candidatus Methanoperedens nitroreducens]MCX9077852.1 hypothetical protein [Candidatus Methanoperedens sp.]
MRPVCLFIFLLVVLSGCVDKSSNQYPLHRDITVTIFWIGENATDENNYIQNSQSAWDSNWKDHFGGIDDPYDRKGFYPGNFIPKENPFYFALPYNDFDINGSNKSKESFCEPICKNKWIKITKGDKTVYAQWEDVGPFEIDDIDYVFGNSKPKNDINDNAGLDVSPAVRDYLGLEDIDKINWQFIESRNVPDGPWTEIITQSRIAWDSGIDGEH